ncbi:MAG: cytochrome c biogenesis protein ResB [Syntrophaceae bacterium]|nr:cytochrome c biogenesis protein ResB [Syntrophaceae bacterium]
MGKKIYNLFSSVKLTVILFLVIAVSSILGTFIEQGLTPEKYKIIFGKTAFHVLNFFNVFDLYHSWWFTFLLLLLSVNLISCTLKQLPHIADITFKAKQKIDYSRFSAPQIIETLHSQKNLSVIEQKVILFLQSISSSLIRVNKNGVSYFFAEKGKFSRWGMTLVHCSVLFILGGGLIGAIWGFSGQMNLVEGGQSDSVYLFGNEGIKKLGFYVACNDFSVKYYETGTPKEYKTNLTIINNDKEVLKSVIRVNHPLTYKGFKFSQASFGLAGAYNFKVKVINNITKEEKFLTVDMMNKVPVSGNDLSFAVARFDSDYMGQGPAVLGVLIRPGKQHDIFWLPKNSSMQRDNYVFTLKNFDTVYYSGIQVNKDPGVILVWIGFILIIVGFILSIFFEHIRIWIRISRDKEGYEISIAANTSKNKNAFKEKINIMIAEYLQGETS